MPQTMIHPPAEPDQDHAVSLMRRAQAGDAAAWAGLWLLYNDALLRFAAGRVGKHRPTAEDIVSDAWVRAMRSINRWEWQGRDPGAWLVTIVRNLVADHFKSGRFRSEYLAEMTPGTTEHDRDDDRPVDDQVAAGRLAVEVEAALCDLTEDQRRVIQLRYLDGLNVAETADQLGRPASAVKALQYRATRSLAQHPRIQAWWRA